MPSTPPFSLYCSCCFSLRSFIHSFIRSSPRLAQKERTARAERKGHSTTSILQRGKIKKRIVKSLIVLVGLGLRAETREDCPPRPDTNRTNIPWQSTFLWGAFFPSFPVQLSFATSSDSVHTLLFALVSSSEFPAVDLEPAPLFLFSCLVSPLAPWSWSWLWS